MSAKKERNKITDYSTQNEIFKKQTGKNFDYFYQKYYPKLLYFITTKCGDHDRAQDLTSESLMVAFEKIEQYNKEKSQFSTWLFTIAKNDVLQDIKKTKKTISMDNHSDDENNSIKNMISEPEITSSKDFDLIDAKHEIVMEEIGKLKSKLKEAITLREIEEMSYMEISIKTDTNLSTVKSRIRNARLELQEKTRSRFKDIENNY
jgi:RNA polymerase sigma-70 factor (ECF subfamily)